ncbi:unnamed protein product [Sphagnum balticum]
MTIMAHCHMQQLAVDHLWSLPQQGLDRVFNGGISDGLAMLLLNLLPKGGSAGSVVAWDMRRQQELIPLAGAIPSMGRSALEFPIVAEGEIWEVKFDPALFERGLMTEVGKVPPVFVCSEDGILVLLQGGEAECLLGEPCAINGFDIDPEVGSDIVCALEHESILYLKRPM